MKKISILCLAMLSFLFSQSQIRYLKGSLQGIQQVPQNNSKGSGVVIVKYDQGTKELRLYGDFSGLKSNIMMAHIHEGAPGTNGPIVVPFDISGDTTGFMLGRGVLSQPQEDSLFAGNMYVNVHSVTDTAGEIRAQLMPASAQATLLTGRLQAAQQVPPNTSKATGSVYALLDQGTDSLFVTGNFAGLTGGAIAAHIHTGLPGTNGNVLFPLYHSAATAGALHVITGIDSAVAVVMLNRGMYANVHTSKYPNGEIRAQLINNTAAVRYLAGTFSGAQEIPATTSAGRGTVIVNYNTETNVLALAGDYQNLSDSITSAALYYDAFGNVADSLLLPLTTTRDSSGVITGTTALPAVYEDKLLNGDLYVNVFSKAFPNGEIRAKLTATAPGETQVFAVALTPGQEVTPPTGPSAAVGSAAVIVDKTTGATFVTGAFTGINSVVSRADLDRGEVGVAGPVIFPLNVGYVSRTRSGTFSGSDTLSPAVVDSMINGFTYINIYSERLTNGAIRGQLGDLVLPLKLKYFNGYKQRNEVQLVWETSEEVNVSRYEIEQLNATTKDWVAKGTVLPQGANSGAKYSFNDVPNLFGSEYAIYRLKMVDKDGRVTYSSIVRINYETLKAELSIQANPVTNGELRYTITGLQSGKKAEVLIIDYNGRLLLRNTVSSLMNNTIKISHLPAGMYKLMVRIDDTLLQKSFIK